MSSSLVTEFLRFPQCLSVTSREIKCFSEPGHNMSCGWAAFWCTGNHFDGKSMISASLTVDFSPCDGSSTLWPLRFHQTVVIVMFYQPLSTLYLQKRDKDTKNGSKIHFCRHVSELIFFPLKASIKQYILIHTNCITRVYFLSGECVRVLQWLRHDTRDFHYWWPLFLPLGLSHDKPPQSFTHKCTHILSHANTVDAHTHTHTYCKTQRYSLFARPRLRAAPPPPRS